MPLSDKQLHEEKERYMQQTQYRKLIRDRVPEIIRQDGYDCTLEIMGEEEYRQALQEKLVEEALEAASANEEHLLTELADLCEVMGALMDLSGIGPEALRNEQQRRRDERGSFKQRLRLLSIISPANE